MEWFKPTRWTTLLSWYKYRFQFINSVFFLTPSVSHLFPWSWKTRFKSALSLLFLERRGLELKFKVQCMVQACECHSSTNVLTPSLCEGLSASNCRQTISIFMVLLCWCILGRVNSVCVCARCDEDDPLEWKHFAGVRVCTGSSEDTIGS